MISTILDGSFDPYILPAPSDIDSYGDQMPLSPAELAYQAIQITSKPSMAMILTNGTNCPPITVPSKDPLDEILPTNEAIQEIMSLEEWAWGDFHHPTSMIDSDVINTEIPSFDPPEMVPFAYTTVQTMD